MEAEAFTTLFDEVEPRLRRALIAWYGPTVGREAAADAMAWAWVHRDRLPGITNVAGYLFRVGQTSIGRSQGRRPVRAIHDIAWIRDEHDVEPRLDGALRALSGQQRACVLLVHSYGYSFREAADALGLSLATVRTHASRGMQKLREQLEVDNDTLAG